MQTRNSVIIGEDDMETCWPEEQFISFSVQYTSAEPCVVDISDYTSRCSDTHRFTVLSPKHQQYIQQFCRQIWISYSTLLCCVLVDSEVYLNSTCSAVCIYGYVVSAKNAVGMKAIWFQVVVLYAYLLLYNIKKNIDCIDMVVVKAIGITQYIM